MKNTIKLEIHKAIKNKLFVISVLLGCAITILSKRQIKQCIEK